MLSIYKYVRMHVSIYIYIYIYICMYVFTKPSVRTVLSGVKQVWIQSFPSSRPVEEPSLPYYFPIAGGIIVGFIPFPGIQMLCEMQLALSRIWTRVTVSISYSDNHQTISTSMHEFEYVDMCACMYVCMRSNKSVEVRYFSAYSQRRLSVY